MLRGLIFLCFRLVFQDFQKIESLESFGASQRFLHLNPNNIEASPGFGLPASQSIERPQFFLNPNLNKIEASQCFEAPRVPKC